MRATKWILLIGIFGFGFSASNLWSAGGRFARVENPNAVDHIPSPFSGTVVGVTASSITLKGVVHHEKKPGVIPNPNESHERTISFPIHPETKIVRDGKTIAATDITKGEQCTVIFTSKPGSSIRHVTDVQIGKAPEKSDAPADSPKKGKKKS